MNAVIALQALEETTEAFETPGFSNLGSLISLYGSCSSSCRPA
ncbi:class III lanthipeptide [Streptomyces sp. NPDC052051]